VTDPSELLEKWRREFDIALDRALPPEGGPVAPLPEAMRHATLSGGKRLRPLLVLAACHAAGGASEAGLPAALAIEMMHTYSLIHDDLPAMDDDALRRGSPTVHVRYGEATAILAGDALQTLAFEVLAGARVPADRLAAQVRTLARAAGADGMAGGQQLDLAAEGAPVTEGNVAEIHRRKTGALFAAALRLGAEAAGAPAGLTEKLTRVGEDLGLAFQIQDDLLDETATSAQLGKASGKDAARGKATWPAAVGRAEATRRVRALFDQALRSITDLGETAAPLAALVRRTGERSS
jgi:farnesyl diphosphate synthase